MNDPDPMGPLLTEITSTLRNGNTVWVVGRLVSANPSQLAAAASPSPLPTRRWLGEYLWYWITQVTVHLSKSALEMKVIEFTMDGPVSRFENLPLLRFSGYRLAPNEESLSPGKPPGPESKLP